MEVEQRKKLLSILVDDFDLSELRKTAFLLLGPGEYENLTGSGKPDKAMSLIEWLHRRGRIYELVSYIREFRSNVDLSDFEIEPAGGGAAQVEFLNRVSEIQYITNPFSPRYLIISAPAGYGKTKLLEVVQTHFQRQGWLCIYTRIPRGQCYSVVDLANEILRHIAEDTSPCLEVISSKECGFEIAHALLKSVDRVQADGILLLWDEVEALEVETAKQLVDELVPALDEGLRAAGYFDVLRVIFSGRYVSNWVQFSHEIPLSLYHLTPFSFPVVQETVTRFSANANMALAPETRQGISSHLMHLTGGHPGCMVEIMKRYRPGWPADDFLLGSKGAQLYEGIVLPVVLDIRSYIPERLLDIFDKLSVIRRFNSRLLRYLIDNNLIEWPESEHTLADALTQTYLVTREESFLQDCLTRRLLATRLHMVRPQLFVSICEKAVDFYERSLKDPETIRPDIIAVELLFQKVQHIYYQQSGDKERIFKYIPELLKCLVTGRDAIGLFQSFLSVVKEDWELKFDFNYFMRDGIYIHEGPYRELIRSIANGGKDLFY